MKNVMKTIKDLLFFSEPKKIEKFILRETEKERKGNGKDKNEGDSEHTNGKTQPEPKRKKNEGLLLKKYAETIPDDKEKKQEKDEGDKKEESEISKDLSVNLQIMKKTYNVPTNGDIVIREFDIVVKKKVIPAFMIFIDGMTDRNVINMGILQPLMLLSNLDIKGEDKDIAQYIKDNIMPHNQVKEAITYNDVIDEVNFGGCGIFVDGLVVAFTADVKGWEHRTVGRPNTELVIRGPQEGFVENIRANTALIRKILKDEDLIVENLKVGKRSKTPCCMMYIKDIANDELVKEVRRRIENINIDFLIDSGELEQYLEDSTFLPAPQIVATERPDRAAGMLVEGKVAVIVHGSPFALVMPTTNNDLIKSTEDAYVRFPYSNLFRLIRIIGVFASLLLPGVYVAITNFHQEMIPTDLLFAISASRERVPFPSVIEILVMEIAFELIREAGIRIPGPIGPTLGIIGALILGQAAVAANIVSPILIIVVAVTGIGSFAVPSFSLAIAFRILRFGYILLAALAGFLGITTGIFLQGIWLVSAKSFGVPYMAPFAPRTSGGLADSFIRSPIWKQETRPDYVNPKDTRRQPRISREWLNEDKEEKDDESR